MKLFFIKLKLWFTLVFNGVSKLDKMQVQAAVEIVENIKNFTHAGAVENFVLATPTRLDNAALALVRSVLERVGLSLVRTLGIWDEIEKETNAPPNLTFGQLILHIREHANALGEVERAGFWHTLSMQITAALSDGRLSMHEIATLTQLIYNQLKHGK